MMRPSQAVGRGDAMARNAREAAYPSLNPPSDEAGAVRQLVLRVHSISGETLPSYVDRLAALYSTTTRSMLERLGLWPSVKSNWSSYGIVLEDRLLKQLSFICGLPDPQKVKEMLLAPYLGPIFSKKSAHSINAGRILAGQSTSVDWAYFKGSHFCPKCLRETGGAWLSR